MAGGWTRDGAVEQQIEDTVKDAVLRARALTPSGESAEECDDCGEIIPKRRREARARGNSVYFPDRVVPMLPEELSADICSLKEGQDRAALACHLKVSKDGEIKSGRFTRAKVRIAANIA
jgi:hypothetical protein